MRKKMCLWFTLFLAVPFNHTESQVIAGKEGWLFFEEDINGFEPKNLERLSNILSVFQKYLGNEGIKVIFSVVPTKYDFYGQKYSGLQYPLANYKSIIDAFNSKNLNFVDINQSLIEKEKTGFLVWTKRNTHWTPQGAESAGQSVGKYIVTKGWLGEYKKLTYSLSVKPIDFVSDVRALLPNNLQQKYAVSERVIAPILKFNFPSESLLGGDSPKVALVGSSYSVLPSDSFAVGIEEAIKTEVINFGIDGGGIWKSFSQFLDSPTYKLNRPTVVVWELPQRLIQGTGINELNDFPNLVNILKSVR